MIPNIFHFCYGFTKDFGGKPFSLVHYLALKSAYEINRPDAVFFYYKFIPEGEWWEKAKKIITLVQIEPPVEVFGNRLYHVAHKSDVWRLSALIEFGGIYMDLDTICVKPFTPLLDNKFVIGKQGRWRRMGLCNAVMMAEKNSEFAKIWLNEYKSFRSLGHDKYWAEHSVSVPFTLSIKYTDLLHIEKYSSFHYPLYYPLSLKKMFKYNFKYEKAYCHHLWENGSWEKYLKNLSVDYIVTKDTTYNLLARRYL
jgi:mannosyltransferase OCH1-like enzyme